MCSSDSAVSFSNAKDFFIQNSDFFTQKCKDVSFRLLEFNGKVFIVSSDNCKKISGKYNKYCLSKNIIGKTNKELDLWWNKDGYCDNHYVGSYFAVISNERASFCENKEGYFYNSNLDAWLSTDNSKNPICPNGKQWNEKQGKCIGFNDCDVGKLLYKGKCLNPLDVLKDNLDSDMYSYIKNNCNSVFHQIDIEDKGSYCYNTYTCKNGAKFNIQVSCGKSNNNSNNNPDNNSDKICYGDEALVVAGDKVYCKKVYDVFKDEKYSNDTDVNNSNNVNNANNKDSFENTGNNNDNGDNINNPNDKGSVKNPDNNDENSCPNPCIIKNQIGVQTSVIAMENYSCNIITYPEFKGCLLKFHIEDGKCIPNCGDDGNDADGNGSNNFNGSGNIDLNETNEKLDNINNTLNDILNVTPDGNFTPSGKGLSDNEKNIFSQFSDFLDNNKKLIDNTLDNLSNLKKLATNKDKYSLTILKSVNKYSCPLNFTLYKQKHSVDICAFVAPYKPLLQPFFTILFSLSVVFGFFRVLIYRSM